MRIKRDKYLAKLISGIGDGMIRVIAGLRRSGKSYLLFNLFYEHLLEDGVKDENIIRISLDNDEFEEYRDPKVLGEKVRARASELRQGKARCRHETVAALVPVRRRRFSGLSENLPSEIRKICKVKSEKFAK